MKYIIFRSITNYGQSNNCNFKATPLPTTKRRSHMSTFTKYFCKTVDCITEMYTYTDRAQAYPDNEELKHRG